MKIFGTALVSYMKGRSGTQVFYGDPRRKMTIARTYRVPHYTDTNEQRGKEFMVFGGIWQTLGSQFKAEGKLYMARWHQQCGPTKEDAIAPNNFYPMFVTIWHKWFKKNPGDFGGGYNDLLFATWEDLCDKNYIDGSIKSLCEVGLLPMVSPIDDLTAVYPQ